MTKAAPFVRAPTAGLNLKSPPWSLPMQASPDLDNVLLHDDRVTRRGGFTPLIRERVLMNSVRSLGWHTQSRLSSDLAAVNGEFLIAPGHLVAGHRPIYYGVTGFTFDLFVEIDDLTSLHGGDGVSGNAPYTINVRPILSKGPLKKTGDTVTVTTGVAGWNTTASTQWGTGGSDGMPFCLYLWNNGTGSAPIWQIRLACHAIVGGIWTLQTVTSGVTPEVGGRYHIIGVASSARVALRVARIYGVEEPVYTGNETTFTSTAFGTNQCPIQVFDCPQQFIDGTETGTGTTRPGLGLTGVGEGGYFFGCKRFEGRCEDLAIWSGDVLSGTNRDRQTKLDVTQQTGLLGYWDMLARGERYVQERTGVGNHLYLVPWGPVFDGQSAGISGKGAWWFNGTTSYAVPDLDMPGNVMGRPAWRYLLSNGGGPPTLTEGAFLDAVRDNRGHGLMVRFWVDSIEPNYEQTIAEIHGVLRLVVATNGTLKGYCRATGAGNTYQGPVTSTFTVVPGRRYSVTLWRPNGGTALQLYVAGLFDNNAAVVVANSAAPTGHAVGGITIGMGCVEPMTNTDANFATLPAVNTLNTDHRSGFCGRIEDLRVVGGQIVDEALEEQTANRVMNQSRLWANQGGTTTLAPFDVNDMVTNLDPGIFVEISGHTVNGLEVRYLIASNAFPVSYGLHANTLINRESGGGSQANYGHISSSPGLQRVGCRLWHTLLHYRLDVDDRDDGFAGFYGNNIEWRFSGATAVANAFRMVHTQASACEDLCNVGGAIERRCIESDCRTEVYANMNLEAWTHRLRPYHLRSPREIGMQWGSGIMRPRAGQSPVSMLADWEQQEGGRRLTLCAAGRTIYEMLAIWEQDSPFASEAQPWSLRFFGQEGDHIQLLPSGTTLQLTGSGGSRNTLVWDCWAKPWRPFGNQTVISCGRPGSVLNYRIALKDGCLNVIGTEAAGAQTWEFTEGISNGTSVMRTHSLRVGAWNHLIVRMNNTGVTAWVNGQQIALVDHNALAGANQRDPYNNAAATAPTVNEVYVGGQPRGRTSGIVTIAVGGSHTAAYSVRSFDGQLSDVRCRSSLPSTSVPTVRASGTALQLLPLNDGSGWKLSASQGVAGDSMIRELREVLTNLEESTGFRYAALAFRDRLIATNGESRPMQIRYTSETDPGGRLRCEQLGIHPPVHTWTTLTLEQIGAGGTLAGIYDLSVTFVDLFGRESEPLFLGSVTITGNPTSINVWIKNLPRSWDPQVVTRRIYAGVGVGGQLLAREVPNNDGADHSITILVGDSGEALTDGERSPAPRARHIAVAGAYLVLADLPEVAAGQNAFAWSQASEPSYWPDDTTAVLDSEDGKPILGIRRNLSHVYLHKRDQVSIFAPAILIDPATVLAQILLVNSSDGAGGASIGALNMLFGCGDRGVFRMTNTTLDYISLAIEPLWRDSVDRRDEVMALRMSGTYHKARSQYWLSTPYRGQSWPTRILVVSLETGAWSRLSVPEHSIMAGIQDVARQTPAPVLGTTSGRLLRYNEDGTADHSDAVNPASGTLQLTGVPSAGSATTLTVAGGQTFDPLLGGHEGASVEIVYNNGAGNVTATRPIDSNSASVLRWSEPLAGFVSMVSFTIGGIDGYWSSPWLANNPGEREQDVDHVQLEFEPLAALVTVEIASIRQGDALTIAFPATSEILGGATIDTTRGWIEHPNVPHAHAQGHWHRLRVRTTGIGPAWALVGYGFEAKQLAATSHGGRGS